MSDADPVAVVRRLLTETDLCTLATASPDGEPEAATMQFVADESFECYFNTFPTYRKYGNLIENPRAAVVVTDPPQSVQMEGDVEELDGEAAATAEAKLAAAFGAESGYFDDPEIRYFRFTPTWIRVLLDATYPPEYAMVRGEGDTELH